MCILMLLCTALHSSFLIISGDSNDDNSYADEDRYDSMGYGLDLGVD